MAIKASTVNVAYFAFDTTNKVGKTGDVANHTIWVRSGFSAPAVASNAPAEIDATHMPGWYQVQLTTVETNADTVIVAGKSSTANILIQGVQLTFETASPSATTIANTVWSNASAVTLMDNVSSMLETVNGINVNVNTINTTVSAINTTVNTINSSVNSIGVLVSNIDTNVSNVLTKVTATNLLVGTINTNLSSLTTTVNDLTNSIWSIDSGDSVFTSGNGIGHSLSIAIGQIASLAGGSFPTPDSIAAAILAAEIETGFSLQDIMKLLAAFSNGLTNGGGTDELTFKDLNNMFDRIKFTLDKNNNRIAVTRDLT